MAEDRDVHLSAVEMSGDGQGHALRDVGEDVGIMRREHEGRILGRVPQGGFKIC